MLMKGRRRLKPLSRWTRMGIHNVRIITAHKLNRQDREAAAKPQSIQIINLNL